MSDSAFSRAPMETAVPAIDTHIMIAGMRVPSVLSIAVPSLLSLSLVACSGGSSDATTDDPSSSETESSSESTSESSEPVDGIPTGTVEGIVRLAPGTTLPMYADNPMVSTGAAAVLPEGCAAANESDRQPVQIGSSGGLTNLVIVATGDRERWPDTAGPRTRTARIEGCRLVPHTMVAERGDTIHFENEATFPFFPDLGTGFTRALLPTDPLDMVLDQGGVRTIGCSFANACGRMEVVTLYHPVFTVSDAEGRFRMTNVPADQDVRVTAWHPLFQEIGGTARVSVGGTATLELVITPVAPPEPPPSTTVPETPRDPLAGDIPE